VHCGAARRVTRVSDPRAARQATRAAARGARRERGGSGARLVERAQEARGGALGHVLRPDARARGGLAARAGRRRVRRRRGGGGRLVLSRVARGDERKRGHNRPNVRRLALRACPLHACTLLPRARLCDAALTRAAGQPAQAVGQQQATEGCCAMDDSPKKRSFVPIGIGPDVPMAHRPQPGKFLPRLWVCCWLHADAAPRAHATRPACAAAGGRREAA
jgi:hypothetical protein